ELVDAKNRPRKLQILQNACSFANGYLFCERFGKDEIGDFVNAVLVRVFPCHHTGMLGNAGEANVTSGDAFTLNEKYETEGFLKGQNRLQFRAVVRRRCIS